MVVLSQKNHINAKKSILSILRVKSEYFGYILLYFVYVTEETLVLYCIYKGKNEIKKIPKVIN